MNHYPSILMSVDGDDPPEYVLMASPDSGYLSPPQEFTSMTTGIYVKKNGPFLQIIEQPVDKFRFRYKSEMAGTHGSLNGCNSDRTRKQSFPTVELCNYTGPAIIRCTLYQHKSGREIDKPHAHRLIKKCGPEELDDPHDIYVSMEDGYQAVFQNMGIIHTAKKNIISELVRRKKMLKEEEIMREEKVLRKLTKKEELDIRNEAEEEHKTIDLNVVCLRFEAFVKSEEGILHPLCQPIYSHGINNLKSAQTGELKIVRMDHCTSPTRGNKEIFILVEKVMKRNIKIRFYEQDQYGNEIWESYGKFNDLDVHHQYAIVFKTPAYKQQNITENVHVFIELVRPTDNARSDPKEFIYTPSENTTLGTKRQRSNENELSEFVSKWSSYAVQNLTNRFDSHSISDSVNLSVLNDVNSAELDKCIAEYFSLETDGPNKLLRLDLYGSDPQFLEPEMGPAYKHIPVSEMMSSYCKEAYDQLYAITRTKVPENKVAVMLRYYFEEEAAKMEHKYNPLHIAVCKNDRKVLNFFLKVITSSGEKRMIDLVDDEGQTPLYLAVETYNCAGVETLLKYGANPAKRNKNGNTCLHLAVKRGYNMIVQDIIKHSKPETVDLENDEGNTALCIAINKKLIDVMIYLLNGHSDVNRAHKKNGFTPLRMAIEVGAVDLVRSLLRHPKIEVNKQDFSGVTPIVAAKIKSDSDKPHGDAEKIYLMLKKHMEAKGIPFIPVKEEDESSEEETSIKTIVEEAEIKSEVFSVYELERLYENVHTFTPMCLESLCEILDASRSWEHLADLLDLKHLLRTTDLFEIRPTKTLLELAINKGETLFQIREFLENLDELAAVKIMDAMVLQIAQSN